MPTEKVKPYPAPSPAGEVRGEGKTTVPLSADPKAVINNRIKTYNGTTYYYDDLGNLIHRELADGEVQNYFYDLHDQLVKAEIFKKDGTKETWAYSYDALGRRIGKGRLKDKEVSETSFPHDLGGNDLENHTRFVWDGSHLLQEVRSDGRYTYIYTDPDSYEPLAQIRNWTTEDGENRQQTHYFHCDQIGIPREMTDRDGRLLWFGDYDGWGRLDGETNITGAHQPFRLQNQYFDEETGLHYNFYRYYEPNAGRFINQDPIGLWGGFNVYQFAPNAQGWVDWLGLAGVDMNLFPSNEDIHSYAQKVANKPNTFQVGGHGNPSLMVDGATGERLDARKLASRIKGDPKYKPGMTVELLSCNTGKGANPLGQQLANELNTTVKAPNEFLWYSSNGNLTPMGMKADRTKDTSKPGIYEKLYPSKQKR